MDINSLIDSISSAVATNDATATWTQAVYGRLHKTYVNLDERQPPDENDCPYVALMPASKQVGQDINPRHHMVDVVCTIHDDDSRLHPEIGLTEYMGVQRLETFRKKIETAAIGALASNLFLSSLDIEYDTITMFPYMLAWMTMDITETVLISSDPFL